MLVSPAPRTSMVLGKILGSATLAWIQGMIFLAFAPLAGVRIEAGEIIVAAGVIFLVAFALTGLGFTIAWRMDSTAGFHAIMNLLLVPMWMVSGSLFPMATAHGWVKAIMWINPLTYSIALLNHTLRLPNASPGAALKLRGDGRVRNRAAACVRHDGRAESGKERGMIRLAAVLALAGLAVSCAPQPPLSVLGDVPPFQLTSQDGQPFDSKRWRAASGWRISFIPPAPGRAP